MHANICTGRRRGEAHPKAKLSDLDVEMMCYLHDVEGLGFKRLAKKFGCHRNTARQICNGDRRGGLSQGDS
jgi:hypothetical protein